jgi:hypothetical protein
MTTMNEEYLGDGLYISYDGFQFVLRAPRNEGNHYVALEPDIFAAFLRYIERTHSVKIRIEKIDGLRNEED